MSGGNRFLARWSQLKRQAGALTEPTAAPPVEATSELPAIESLGPDADFTAFMRAEVSEALRRQALQKLFADPRFNVMDGLDVYIDDYSLSEPIAEDVLASLNQARTLFGGPEAPAEAGAPTAQGCDNLAKVAQKEPQTDESTEGEGKKG